METRLDYYVPYQSGVRFFIVCRYFITLDEVAKRRKNSYMRFVLDGAVLNGNDAVAARRVEADPAFSDGELRLVAPAERIFRANYVFDGRAGKFPDARQRVDYDFFFNFQLITVFAVLENATAAARGDGAARRYPAGRGRDNFFDLSVGITRLRLDDAHVKAVGRERPLDENGAAVYPSDAEAARVGAFDGELMYFIFPQRIFYSISDLLT